MMYIIRYKFDIFNTPLMTDAEFDSKPQVMLVGQYSVGKTSVRPAPLVPSQPYKCFLMCYEYSLLDICWDMTSPGNASAPSPRRTASWRSWTDRTSA